MRFFAMEVREALGLVDAAASVGVTEPTWFGLEGHPKCCDHIWVAAAARSGILVAGVEPDSISECEREDHKMVWCKLDGMLAPLGPRPEPSLKLDRGLLADERATAAFRHALREARHGVLASASKGPDAMHAEVVSCVGRLQQEHFFSRQPSAPTKPWISAATWDLVKTHAGKAQCSDRGSLRAQAAPSRGGPPRLERRRARVTASRF